MSIGAVNSSTVSAVAPTSQSSQPSLWQSILGAASSTLGISPSSLQQQLQGGQSLASVAQSKGVSSQTLVASVTSALAQSAQASGVSGVALTKVATNIVNQSGSSERIGGGHRHHHRGGYEGAPAATPAAATGAASGGGSVNIVV